MCKKYEIKLTLPNLVYLRAACRKLTLVSIAINTLAMNSMAFVVSVLVMAFSHIFSAGMLLFIIQLIEYGL